MKVLLTPRQHEDRIEYVFTDERTVVVTYNGEFEETFDLINDFEQPYEGDDMITRKRSEVLPINPIISVRYENDERHVDVFRYHGPNPSDDIVFPDWQEVRYGETYPYPLS